MTKYIVAGCAVDSISKVELAHTFLRDVKGKALKAKLVFSLNGEGVYRYNRDPKIKQLIDSADIVHPDGMSVVLAGRYLSGGEFVERVATTDAFHNVAEISQRNGCKHFFLGASEFVNEKAVSNVKKQYPNLNVVGRHDGYFSDDDWGLIVNQIQDSQPDIVWIALGRPKQEIFSSYLRDNLENVTWIKTCGGLFDFLAGRNTRAPQWMQAYGLEWFYRTIQEPRRLFYKNFVLNILSIFFLITRSRKL